mgnify:CR=1 FL=1
MSGVTGTVGSTTVVVSGISTSTLFSVVFSLQEVILPNSMTDAPKNNLLTKLFIIRFLRLLYLKFLSFTEEMYYTISRKSYMMFLK